MKKNWIYLGVILCLFSFVGSDVMADGWSFAKLDTVLTQLLNVSYNDPFLTSSKRQDYLELAIKRVSSTIGLYPFDTTVIMDANVSALACLPKNTSKILGVQTLDGSFSRTEITGKDVGQGQLSASTPAQYYHWVSDPGGDNDYLFIYPPNPTNPCTSKVYVEKATPTFSNVRQIANDIILQYALYRCHLQSGEGEIAQWFKQTADSQLLDLKNVLENRPIDVTLEKKVLSK